MAQNTAVVVGFEPMGGDSQTSDGLGEDRVGSQVLLMTYMHAQERLYVGDCCHLL